MYKNYWLVPLSIAFAALGATPVFAQQTEGSAARPACGSGCL